MSTRRLHLVVGAAALATMTTLVAAVGSAGAAPSGGSSTSTVVRAGAKAIGHSGKQSTSGLVSLRSSQPTGAVEPTPGVYLVFWGSQWSKDPAGAASALTNLFSDLYGTNDNWGTILDQYCEGLAVGTTNCGASGTHVQHPTSPLLLGTWADNGAQAPLKATASQIAAEAVSAAAHFGTTPAKNLNVQYVIASPTGTHPDGFPKGFCGWHSSVSSTTYGNIAYTNLPYVPDISPTACTTYPSPGPLDGYESTETHEYAESVTDPFPSNGWLKGGAEIGDLCENLDAHLTIDGATFDVQGLWSNAADACVTSSSTG